MDSNRDPQHGEVPLPGATGPSEAAGWWPEPPSVELDPLGRATQGQAQSRAQGLRNVRRLSNWTAAALIVGTGAATVALAHNALPVTPPTLPGSSVSGTATTGAAGVTNGAHGPQVSHSVATTSASGVTTTTTTLPNGRTVVTHSGRATYHDD